MTQYALATTPFGRRPLTLAQVASQVEARARTPEQYAHKWSVFRAICAARAQLGVSERALAVLDALLTFHPETVLAGENLVVFPSNRLLSLRAHGMAPATLRRHLAALVEAGFILRRDSPNGKRYARKDGAGEIEIAFGFDLAPLVARAEEFEALAEAVRAEERALKRVRERISICRRDIAKMITMGLEEGASMRGTEGVLEEDWHVVHQKFCAAIAKIPRSATRADLEPVAEELARLSAFALKMLEDHIKTQNISANESQTERHIQNSNPDSYIEFEPCLSKKEKRRDSCFLELDSKTADPTPTSDIAQLADKPAAPNKARSLGMVLEACPDIVDYAKGGVDSWGDLIAAAGIARAALGVSADAWREAQKIMGAGDAAAMIAAILQKGAAIGNPGGYLRAVSAKARAKEFSIGPVLIALLRGRLAQAGRTRKPARAVSDQPKSI